MWGRGGGGEGMSRKGIEMLCDYSSETEISEEGSGKDTCYLPWGIWEGIEMFCDKSLETETSEQGSRMHGGCWKVWKCSLNTLQHTSG